VVVTVRRKRRVPPVSESLEEFGRRAGIVYESSVRPHLSPADQGKFIAVDVATGSYEVDIDELVAEDRLLGRVPGAAVWLARIGSRYAHCLGGVLGCRPEVSFPHRWDRIFAYGQRCAAEMGLTTEAKVAEAVSGFRHRDSRIR
jgi:hypothetical protein